MTMDAREIAVLVADPNPEELAIVLQMLRELGLTRLTSTGDGYNALIQIKKNPFHLVLASWNLPRLNVPGLIDQLRKIPRFNVPGVIAMVSHADRDLIENASANGIGEFLVKPFNIGSLQKKMESVLGARILI